MRLIFIFPGIVFGGAESRTLELCKELKSIGHEPMVACGAGPSIEVINRYGIPYHKLPVTTDKVNPFNSLRCIVKLVHIINRHKIDAVITYRRNMAFIAHYATRLTSTYHVYTNVSIYCDKRWLRWTGDFTIAISKACLQNAIDFLKADRSRCCLIYRGVNKPKSIISLSQSREKLNIDIDTPLIGTVCRLVLGKGLHILLKAMVEVNKHINDTCLLIVGDGTEKIKLEMLAKTLGLSRIVFLGERRDIWDILPAFDVFVMPSIEKEGLGSALIEAASCGIPLIGTICGGIPEIIENGQNGFLIPPKNHLALAEAIVKILSDPTKAKEIGMKAKEITINKFSKEREVLQTIGVLEAILNREQSASKAY